MYSFITDGNFIIFKYTEDVPFVYSEEQSAFYEHEVFKLHNTSTCIDWSLGEDTTKITFTIDEQRYENIPLSSIDFDGEVCGVQQDFIDGIQAMFENLAGGGEEGGASYLVYAAILSQSGTDNPVANVLENTLGGTVVWARDNAGSYTGTLSNAFTVNKTWVGPKIQYKSAPTVDDEYLTIVRDSASAIGLDHFSAGEQVDVFTNIPIEIRVYP